MKMSEISIYSLDGKETEKFKLDEKVFLKPVNKALLADTLVMYRANKRKGLASTKSRGKIRGGGTKPWRQKGTGRARVGTIRSPLWKGGGVVFGPQPRDYTQHLTKKVKKQALMNALVAKFEEKHCLVVDKLSISSPKTKEFLQILNNVSKKLHKPTKKKEGLKGDIKKTERFLFVVEENSKNLFLASRNVNFANVVLFYNVNALDILLHDYVIFTKKSLDSLLKKIK